MVAADLVCSVDELPQVTPDRLTAAGWNPERPFRVCALGPALAGPGALGLQAHKRVAGGAVAFGEEGRLPERGVASYELKCPVDALDSRAVEAFAAVRAGVFGAVEALYVEPECASPEWPGAVESVFRFFDGFPASERPGLKVRCSGPAAIDPDSLSRVIAAAIDRGMRLKATAGLHYPVADPTVGGAMGFLGLALAVRLRRAFGSGFSMPAMIGCMTASDPLQFSFNDGAGWMDFRLDRGQLSSRPGFTIGSCSLQEPDEELVRLFPKQSS